MLVEHKSAVDRRIGLQLLRYLVRIWERVDREAGGRGALPPIVPLVVYHGVERWAGPGRFADLIAAEPAVAAHVLDFPFGIVDLGRIPDRELSGEPRLRAGLALLKHVFLGTDPRALLDEAAVAACRADRAFFETLLRYIVGSMGAVERPVILDLVARVLPGEEEAVLSKFAEEWWSKGRLEGRLEGKAEGRAEGKAELLLRQLQRRFGAVPERWRAVVLAADGGQLEAWGEAIFDAASLDDLLGTPKPH